MIDKDKYYELFVIEDGVVYIRWWLWLIIIVLLAVG